MPRLERLEDRRVLSADLVPMADVGEPQAEGEAEQMVGIRPVVTDLDGNPLPVLTEGEDFALQLLVQDLRADADFYGVFAAYFDTVYDPTLVSVTGEPTFGAKYPNGHDYDLSQPGLIDEAGAFDGLSPLGTDEYELFSVPMRALQTGEVTFATDPAEDLPAHYVLLFGRDDPVPEESIVFEAATFNILPPPAQYIVDNSDPGYLESGGGWFTGGLPGAVQGDYRYHQAGNGTNAATWTFTDLPSGQYQVSATWVPHPNRATNAPFEVIHNGVTVGPFRVNQTANPTDEVVDGQPWETLTTVDVTTGALKVRLTDGANAAVVADAIRLLEVRVVPQPPQIGAVAVTPLIVAAGNPVEIEAQNVTDEGTVEVVRFYRDVNGNGTVQASIDQLLATDTNGADGYRAIIDTSGFTPGNYVFLVQAEDDDGMKSTASASVEVTDAPPSPPPFDKVIDDGEPGYSESGTWFTGGLAGANQGDYRYSRTSQGSATARWSFSNLPAGDYRVMATWVAHSNRASNASFRISDATVVRATKTINQQQNPDDETVNQQPWENLATVNIQSGNLLVELPNTANGVVIADAIRVVAAGSTPPPGPSAPTIQSLSASPSSVVVGGATTITANGVNDSDGSVSEVRFYRDANGNQTLEVGTDTLLSVDSNGGDGYRANFTSGPPSPATVRFYAQAIDDSGATSNVVTTVLNVTADTPPPPPPPANDRFLDDGESGYSEQGSGWFTGGLAGSYQGDYRYTQTGDGSRQAQWLLDNVSPGTYDVFTTWVPHANRASDAKYEVFDNSASLGVVVVNQQQAPAGPNADGQVWHKLGQFIVNNGNLRVVLNNNANGVVIADAVRLVPIPVGPQKPVIGQLNVTPSSVLQGGQLTIRAEQVSDLDGTVVQVDFYRDTNGNQTLEVGQDALVGTDTTASGGFQVTEDSTSLALGPHRYFARAVDDDGLLSDIATDVANVVDFADLFVDNTDAGYTESGSGWFTGGLAGAFRGDYRYHQPGTGGNVARFTVDGLLDGDYEVFATWTPHPNRASNAHFQVFDNTTFRTEARVSQQQAPNDDVASQQDWESLGTVRVQSGRLVVQLSDDADGVVIADAIRVVGR